MYKNQKIVVFCVADTNNLKYYEMFKKSFRHFHPEDEIELKLYSDEDLAIIKDSMLFYRQKPYFGNKLLKEGYDLVIGVDVDQLCLGRWDYIFESDYDVGTVLNLNRVDPLKFTPCQIATVMPNMYFNCGLVAMRSQDFTQHWLNLCYSDHFLHTQYKEQDLLNLMCYYGNYKVRCFDMYDPMKQYSAWHGLKAKGECMRTILKGNDIVLPKGDGNTPYPDRDVIIKAVHWGEGNVPNKMNYRIMFPEEIVEYIDLILK